MSCPPGANPLASIPLEEGNPFKLGKKKAHTQKGNGKENETNLEHDGGQVGSTEVDSGGVASGSGSNDDDLGMQPGGLFALSRSGDLVGLGRVSVRNGDRGGGHFVVGRGGKGGVVLGKRGGGGAV